MPPFPLNPSLRERLCSSISELFFLNFAPRPFPAEHRMHWNTHNNERKIAGLSTSLVEIERKVSRGKFLLPLSRFEGVCSCEVCSPKRDLGQICIDFFISYSFWVPLRVLSTGPSTAAPGIRPGSNGSCRPNHLVVAGGPRSIRRSPGYHQNLHTVWCHDFERWRHQGHKRCRQQTGCCEDHGPAGD